MDEAGEKWGLVLAGAAGLALWSAIAWFGGRTEPWDAPAYWELGYPLSLALAGLFGVAFPARPWRWALVLTFAQLPVMLANGSGLSLLPLGLLLLGVLSLPLVLAAKMGAVVSRALSS